MTGITTVGVLHDTEGPGNNPPTKLWATPQGNLEPLHYMKPNISAHQVYFPSTQNPADKKGSRNYYLPCKGDGSWYEHLSMAGGRPRLPWVNWKPKIDALALSPQKDWADFHTMIIYSLVSIKLLLCRLRLSHLDHKRFQSAVLLLGKSCGSSHLHIVLPAASAASQELHFNSSCKTFKHLIKSSCLSQWENTYAKYFTQ